VTDKKFHRKHSLNPNYTLALFGFNIESAHFFESSEIASFKASDRIIKKPQNFGFWGF